MATRHTHRSSYLGHAWVGGTRRQLLTGSAAWLTVAALGTGCASKPEKPVVTPVKLTLIGGADVNPDARGRASPLVTRAYALKSPGAFETADFFTLFEKDTATLGADLVKREEALLRPGGTQQFDWILESDVKAIGLMGAYRDLSRAQWRQVVLLQVGQPHQLTASFGARVIAIDRR